MYSPSVQVQRNNIKLYEPDFADTEHSVKPLNWCNKNIYFLYCKTLGLSILNVLFCGMGFTNTWFNIKIVDIYVVRMCLNVYCNL